MRVAEAFKSTSVVDFNNLTIDATALYALAALEVPQSTREEAIERAEAGEHLTLKDAQEMVAKAVAARAETEAEIIAKAACGGEVFQNPPLVLQVRLLCR